MNRRGFLGLLGGAVAAVAAPAALVEALEPKRTIFLPPRGGWAGDFDTANMRFKATERFGYGFTDVRALNNPLMTREQMYAELQKGLNEVFEKAYADQRMFGDGFVKWTDEGAEHVPVQDVYLGQQQVEVRTDPRLTDPNSWYIQDREAERRVKRFFRARVLAPT